MNLEAACASCWVQWRFVCVGCKTFFCEEHWTRHDHISIDSMDLDGAVASPPEPATTSHNGVGSYNDLGDYVMARNTHPNGAPESGQPARPH